MPQIIWKSPSDFTSPRPNAATRTTPYTLTSTTGSGIPSGATITSVKGYFYLGPEKYSSYDWYVHHLTVTNGYSYSPSSSARYHQPSCPGNSTAASYLPADGTSYYYAPSTNMLTLTGSTATAFYNSTIDVTCKIMVGTGSTSAVIPYLRNIYIVVDYETPYVPPTPTNTLTVTDYFSDADVGSSQSFSSSATANSSLYWKVTSNTNWTVSVSGDDWLTISPTYGGSGTTIFYVTVRTPPTSGTYTSTLTFKIGSTTMKTVAVSMTKASTVTPTFSVTDYWGDEVYGPLSYDSDATSSNVWTWYVSSNTAWDVTQQGTAWLTLQKGDGYVSISPYLIPPSGTTYTAQLVFSAGGQNMRTISVSMTGAGGGGSSGNTLTVTTRDLTMQTGSGDIPSYYLTIPGTAGVGSSFVFTVNSDYAWQMNNANFSWCTISPKAHNGTGSVDVTVTITDASMGTNYSNTFYFSPYGAGGVKVIVSLSFYKNQATPTITWNGITASANGKYARIEWDDVTVTNGSGGVTYWHGDTQVTSPYELIPTNYNTEISYTITAKYSGVSSSQSVSVTVYGKLNPPTNVTASAVENQPTSVKLTWTAASVQYGGGSVSSYSVRYRKNGSSTWSAMLANMPSGVTLSGLETDKYIFEVIAIYSGSSSVTASAQSNVIDLSVSGVVRYWTGSVWQECEVKYWNGTGWQDVEIRYWNGSTWVEM